jgi:predicted ATPase
VLTRLEVDGFKNLLGFDCHFGPYTCIAGPNAVGKSNIFDAIEFMSLLADLPFLDATQRLRVRGDQIADPRSLFWNNAESNDPVISLAAEMIVPSQVEDDFGRQVAPTTTFLRYELKLRYMPPEEGAPQTGRLRLEHEMLTHLKLGEAHLHLPWPHSKKDFRDKIVKGRRSGVAYISTTRDDSSGERVVNVHQDGGSSGKPRPSAAARAPRTIVSTTTSSDDQTILAAKREMQQWRMLALEPSAMRAPDSALQDPHVTPSGAHLAATLFRMSHDQGPHIYAEVTAGTAALTDLREIRVDHDQRRDTLTIEGRLGEGPMLPARSLSDGTLRFLALCIMRADDEVGGLLCMEEPENGIHPGRVETMVDLVRSLAVDPFESPGSGNPLRQVMVNTHSPHFIRYQHQDDVLAAMPVSVLREGLVATTVRLLPMPKTWRAEKTGAMAVSSQALVDYLREPTDALFTLDELQ